MKRPNPEDPLELDFYDITVLPPLSRRDFFRGVGGGIVVLFLFGELPQAGAAEGGPAGPAPGGFNAYLRVGADGRVACFTGKIEMGQGVHTSLAMQLADELEVPLDRVDMVMGDTALCPYDQGTWGSLTTRFFAPVMVAAAAEARAVLVALAADHLKVPAKRLVVAGGAVHDRKDPAKRVTYAELAKGKKITRQLSGKPKVEGAAEQSLVGKPGGLRRDARDKVTGRAKFSADMRLPAMVHARILRPPAHGAKRGQVDTSGVASVAGARVVEAGDLIAVVHEDPELADAALATIKVKWQVPKPDVDDETIFERLVTRAPKGEVADSGGSLAAGAKASKGVIEATYTNAYVAHAPMEPHAALAAVSKGEAVIWASTQNPFGLQEEAAEALGIAKDKVRVISPFVGGGFGGKSKNGQAVEAALLARAAGVPVQVAWSRAEEFFYDAFRPAAVVKIRAGLDARTGRLALWDFGTYSAGQRGAIHFYDIPHHATVVYGSGWRGRMLNLHPFATGAWRAPANNTNTFARESHIDTLAAAAKQDPVAFRLAHLTKDARMKRVLEAAAAKFGWTPEPAPSGRGFGVACGVDAGTVVAAMAEVAVDRASGKVQVKRVVVAQEMGTVINPAGAVIQAEGCIIMGLGYALTEEIRFKGGAIEDANFDTYEIPRLSWTPTIDTVLLDVPPGTAPQGGGEPAIVVVGGLIANAIFDATGARLTHLPMTPARVKAAAAKVKGG